jgi:DNA-binding response OmpR family regulator
VYNLLTNAIKFTKPGGKINLSISQILNNNLAQLEIKIKDTGVGISSEDLPNIFERFYQADFSDIKDGRSKTFGGTGIGLALTKELVGLMKGEINVESELSWGTTFTVHLPIKRSASEVISPETNKVIYTENDYRGELKEIEELPDQYQSDKPALLLIEDNSGVVTYVKAILEEMYDIHVATNGREGIEMALQHIPDIVITDVMMPEKNGYEVCDFLKKDERTSHIPIIILTAKADVSSRIEGLETGADAYLSKPFEKEELIVRLENLLKIRKTLQDFYSKGGADLKQAIVKDDSESVFVQNLKDFIETNIQDSDLSVQKLSDHRGVSHIQLYRKLKALTGQTPSQFIRSVRLQKAVEFLKDESLNISEIAYLVGFNDPNYFTRVFKQEYGKVPGIMRDESRKV